MMLEIVAKCENGLFKKLSYFRLEIYKKYGARYTAKIKTVENSVESVEFHPKSRHGHWVFEHFPRTFQHVEKIEGDLQSVYGLECGKLLPKKKLRRKCPHFARTKFRCRKNREFYSKEPHIMVYFKMNSCRIR